MGNPDDFSLDQYREDERREAFEAYKDNVNPQYARVLETIGFDRNYVRGEGSYLWDENGTKYLDFLSGFGMFNMGRNHPVILEAVREYLELEDPWKVAMGWSPWPGRLAGELLECVPHLDKVYFGNSGAECVEAALKFARRSTGRRDIIYCDGAFHGLTYGALSVNGSGHFRDGFGPFLPGMRRVPFGDLEALEAQFRHQPPAGFILEPIQGKGVHRADPDYLLGVQRLCRKHDVVFILDEVQTGLGRTGELFAYQHVEGLEPDILLVSKSLSGGMVPVGAAMMRDEIYGGVYTDMENSVIHGSTFGQGALPMVCGLAALHVLQSEGLVERAARKGERLREGLRTMVPEYELLEEVRGQGLMIAIEFGKPASTSLRAAWSMLHAADEGLFPQAMTMPLLDKHQILTQVGGHEMDGIKILPPLTTSDGDIEWFLEAFEDVLDDLHQFPGGPLWTTAKHLSQFALSSASGAGA